MKRDDTHMPPEDESGNLPRGETGPDPRALVWTRDRRVCDLYIDDVARISGKSKALVTCILRNFTAYNAPDYVDRPGRIVDHMCRVGLKGHPGRATIILVVSVYMFLRNFMGDEVHGLADSLLSEASAVIFSGKSRSGGADAPAKDW